MNTYDPADLIEALCNVSNGAIVPSDFESLESYEQLKKMLIGKGITERQIEVWGFSPSDFALPHDLLQLEHGTLSVNDYETPSL